MATSVGALYLQLGLNLSELETGFVTASQTVAANINRLNRESSLIRLRSQVQIEGLDQTADAERILQIRTNALNQQMAIQRDRCRILTAELRSLTAQHGANAVATQRAAIRLERERLTLAQLETEFNSLNESTSIFQEFQESLPSMPTKLQAIGIAAGAMTAGIGAAATATKELLEEFRELQTQSYELNMPIPDTRNFLRQLRLGGGDIGDFEGYIRGITDAYVKGEYDDPEFIALRKYGAEITDATGRLKDFKDLTEEVYQAWKKADAAGEGIEFLQLTGGEAGVRDAIQLFKRYEEAKADAAKIFTADIDEKQLHELDRTLNLLEEQAGELKKEFGSLFTPLAQATGEKFFQLFHDGTEYIAENKDAIQSWGFIAAETFDTIADKLSELTSYQMPDTGDKNVDKMLDGLQWRMAEANEYALWGDKSPWSKIFSQLPKDIAAETGILERAKERQKEYNGELDETKEKIDEVKAALEDADGNPLSQYGQQRLDKFKQELEDLRIELDFGDNDYLKAFAELDLWRKRERETKNYLSTAEREAIEQLYAAKSTQIEQERADKLQEIRDQIAAADKTALENKLDNIEKERQAWLKAGMDEAEATELAEQQKANYIKGIEEELSASLQSIYQTELENRLTQIEKEKQAWIDKCGDEVRATELAEQQKMDAQRNAAMQVIKQQAKEYEAYQQGGVEGLRNYKLEQLEKSGVNLGLLNMTPQQLQQFQKANQIADKSLLPNFMTATDIADYWAQVAQKMQPQQQEQTQPQPAIENETFKNLETSAQSAAEAQKTFADSLNNLPPDYFRRLADQIGTVAVMQGNLTQSTIDLIDAQGKLSKSLATFPKAEKQSPVKDTTQSIAATTKASSAETESQRALRQALSKLPDAVKSFQSPSTDRQLPTKDFSMLADSTQDVRQAQDSLARTAAETRTNLEKVKYPEQTQITPKDSGIKFGFDYDTAKDIFLTGAGMAAASAGTGVGLAFTPEILAGAIVAAGVGGFVKGSYDETTAQPESTERPQPLSDIDFSGVITPLTSIDSNLQSVLQTLQDQSIDTADAQPYQSDALQELFGELPNIRADVQSIFQEMQARGEIESPVQTAESIGQDYLPTLINIDGNLQSVLTELQAQSTQETTMTFETIVTPLNNIAGLVQQVLSALSNRQPPQVTVSPSISNNLGGAYVFDNAMKKSLVDDITSQIVSAITSAVQQATSQSNYSYGA